MEWMSHCLLTDSLSWLIILFQFTLVYMKKSVITLSSYGYNVHVSGFAVRINFHKITGSKWFNSLYHQQPHNDTDYRSKCF